MFIYRDILPLAMILIFKNVKNVIEFMELK